MAGSGIKYYNIILKGRVQVPPKYQYFPTSTNETYEKPININLNNITWKKNILIEWGFMLKYSRLFYGNRPNGLG